MSSGSRSGLSAASRTNIASSRPSASAASHSSFHSAPSLGSMWSKRQRVSHAFHVAKIVPYSDVVPGWSPGRNRAVCVAARGVGGTNGDYVCAETAISAATTGASALTHSTVDAAVTNMPPKSLPETWRTHACA